MQMGSRLARCSDWTEDSIEHIVGYDLCTRSQTTRMMAALSLRMSLTFHVHGGQRSKAEEHELRTAPSAA